MTMTISMNTLYYGWFIILTIFMVLCAIGGLRRGISKEESLGLVVVVINTIIYGLLLFSKWNDIILILLIFNYHNIFGCYGSYSIYHFIFFVFYMGTN